MSATILDQFRLDGQTAVVTGAFGKLGTVWLTSLLEAGAKVAALDVAGAKPTDFVKGLQDKYTAKYLGFFEGDITNKQQLLKVRGQVETQLGTPTILVNNAGIDAPPVKDKGFKLEEIPADIFSRIVEVNLTGSFICSQVFGEKMASQGRGSIINIGSLYASVSPDARFYDHIEMEPPFIKPPAYGASKAALLNLTKYFATHWGPKGVRVNALSPGGVEGGQDPEFKRKFTARVPLGRMAQPDDLRGPLLFLASDASRYVTGIELRVEGGFTVW